MADKNLAIRCFIWNLFFFALCLFCVFYLKDKPEIKNFDIIPVFLPLVFLAFSTEMFKVKAFHIFAIADFTLKVLAYVFAQLIFRRIVMHTGFWVCLSLFFICFLICFAFSIITWQKSKKFWFILKIVLKYF